jgi:4-hydroxybenzoyl-CoA reductase subunit beta
MTLPHFQYFAPASLEESLALMARIGDDLKVIAGATEITGRLKHRLVTPSCVLSLRKVPGLKGIRREENEIVIGAMTTLREIAESALIENACKAVCQAADAVAAPPIQNMATLGGNLLQNTRCLYYNQSELVRKAAKPCIKAGGITCLAVKGGKKCKSVYQGDMAPALLACGAKVKIEKTGSSRLIGLSELFTGSASSPFALGTDELLTEIRLPAPAGRHTSSYKKLRLRGSLDYPLASAAVFLSFDKGTVSDARLVFGAFGPAPVLVSETAALLKGKTPAGIDVKKVLEPVTKAPEAVDNLGLSGSYRRKMIKILAARALQEALDDSTKAGS